MKFVPTPLAGAYTIELEPKRDERGFFARQFCQKEFQDAGLVSHFVQANVSFNAKAYTLRGMHYQIGEAAEEKVVRCVRGAIWDCILDLFSGVSR